MEIDHELIARAVTLLETNKIMTNAWMVRASLLAYKLAEQLEHLDADRRTYIHAFETAVKSLDLK